MMSSFVRVIGKRSFVRALAVAALFLMLSAVPAFAQTDAPAPDEGGQPWHWWMALGALAIGALTLLAAIAGYLIQAPGFKKTQHKQGQPR